MQKVWIECHSSMFFLKWKIIYSLSTRNTLGLIRHKAGIYGITDLRASHLYWRLFLCSCWSEFFPCKASEISGAESKLPIPGSFFHISCICKVFHLGIRIKIPVLNYPLPVIKVLCNSLREECVQLLTAGKLSLSHNPAPPCSTADIRELKSSADDGK